MVNVSSAIDDMVRFIRALRSLVVQFWLLACFPLTSCTRDVGKQILVAIVPFSGFVLLLQRWMDSPALPARGFPLRPSNSMNRI